MADVDFNLAKIKKLAINLFTGSTAFLNNNSLFKFQKVDKSQHVHYHISQSDLTKLQDQPQKAEELRLNIQEYISSGGDYLIADPANVDNLTKISSIIYDRSRNKLLEFIEKAIPIQDRALWISALTLRSTTNPEEIRRIKNDIVVVAGHRGANIANLCTAQYLETRIIPLYNQLFELTNGNEIFADSYERIVTYPVFAVFVSGVRSQEEILDEIRNKTAILLTNGEQYQYTIDIHGMNALNVAKIKKLLPTIIGEYEKNIAHQSVRGGETYIKVQITFNPKNSLSV